MSQRKNKKEIREYVELKENKNITYQNLWDNAKALFREIVITIHTYVRKDKRSQISNLSFCLKNQKS